MPTSEQKLSKPDEKLSIGDIVTLKPHPYFSERMGEIINISGDPVLISPMMIVVETLKGKQLQTIVKTDQDFVSKETYQYKCIWYSQKKHSIEEAWLSSLLIKLISTASSDSLVNIEALMGFGTSVILKTAKIELGKKKSSLSIKGNKNDSNKIITSLLSFIPPVMQVIGTVKSESKDALIDLKTEAIKREIPKILIKCKYYNSFSDKFSEALIPVEALEIIKKPEQSILDAIVNTIERKGSLIVNTKNRPSLTTIVNPLNINYRSGYYFLEGHDLLKNRQVEVSITWDSNQFLPYAKNLAMLPKFEIIEERMTFIPINEQNIGNLTKNKYWIIKYKDFNENFTTRTIYNQRIKEIFYINDDGEPKSNNYIEAECLLRTADRYFRIDKIQEIIVLDLDFPKTEEI